MEELGLHLVGVGWRMVGRNPRSEIYVSGLIKALRDQGSKDLDVQPLRSMEHRKTFYPLAWAHEPDEYRTGSSLEPKRSYSSGYVRGLEPDWKAKTEENGMFLFPSEKARSSDEDSKGPGAKGIRTGEHLWKWKQNFHPLAQAERNRHSACCA